MPFGEGTPPTTPHRIEQQPTTPSIHIDVEQHGRTKQIFFWAEHIPLTAEAADTVLGIDPTQSHPTTFDYLNLALTPDPNEHSATDRVSGLLRTTPGLLDPSLYPLPDNPSTDRSQPTIRTDLTSAEIEEVRKSLGDRADQYLDAPLTTKGKWLDPLNDWGSYQMPTTDLSQVNQLSHLINGVFNSRNGAQTHPEKTNFTNDIINNPDKPFLIIDAHGGSFKLLFIRGKWYLSTENGESLVEAGPLFNRLAADGKYSTILVHACNGSNGRIDYTGDTPIYISLNDIGGRKVHNTPNVVRLQGRGR